MKNRKLFAILTLVAFMMTLLPMAAFATTQGDRFATAQTVTVNKTTVDADDTDYATISVYVYDSGNNAKGGQYVYLASSRGGTDKIFGTGTQVVDAVPGATNIYYAVSASDGKVEFKVRSSVAGTAKFALGLEPDSAASTDAYSIYQYLVGNSAANAANVQLIATKEITFEASGANQISIFDVKVRDRANDANATTQYSGANKIDNVANVYYDDNGAHNKANNLDYYTVKVRVTNSSKAPVANQTVDFSINKSAGRLSATSAETDSNGVASVKVYATKGGVYEVTANASGASVKTYVYFVPSDATDIKLASADNTLKAKGTKPNFDFELFDANGNRIKTANTKVEVITKPDGVDLNDSSFTKTTTADDLYNVAFKNNLTKLGKYTLRVSLDNGKYADVSFELKEQGPLVRMTVDYKASSLALGTTSKTPTVKVYDANNVEKTLTNNSLTWTLSDSSKGTIDANGVFTATSDKNYAGPVTITALNNTDNLVASATIEVAQKFASIIAENPTDRVQVGNDAVVALKAVDVNGNQVSIGGDATVTDMEDFYVTAKPEGANVYVETASGFSKNMREKGTANILISSTEAGTVSIVARVKVTINGADTVYAVPVTVEFGAPKAAVGAKNVTMFIGSTGYVVDGAATTMDQAPFIQDNRTFVPLRAVATALGATNQDTMWDPATQTITLVRPDLTVTMTIGSNVLTLSDGTTVVADVAPFIVAETGRTVIPFRAIAEAFGAQVEAVFAADGTVTAVTFQQ